MRAGGLLLRPLSAVRGAAARCFSRQGPPASPATAAGPAPVLTSFDVTGVAEFLRSGRARNVVVMTGAGLSTAAGIPDFRTPGTGLYNNLQRFDLPNPEAIFSLDHLRKDPRPFFSLCRELYPGQHAPTLSHFFIRLLEEKGLLRRVFTQNIDGLERLAGVSDDRIVEAHGSFAGAACVDCGRAHEPEWVRERIFAQEVPGCRACGGIVKPSIVMFGENLPARFFSLAEADLATGSQASGGGGGSGGGGCDLLLVVGTSLEVHPFAGLVGLVADDCPRLLLNRDPVGTPPPGFLRRPRLGGGGAGGGRGERAAATADGGFGGLFGGPQTEEAAQAQAARGFLLFEPEHAWLNRRDAAFLGDCDEGVRQLAEALGWTDELEALHRAAAHQSSGTP